MSSPTAIWFHGAVRSALLLDDGSRQQDLWGIGLYPEQFGSSEFVGFDSVVSIRPSQAKRTRSVDDAAVRERILAIVGRLVTP